MLSYSQLQQVEREMAADLRVSQGDAWLLKKMTEGKRMLYVKST